MGGLGNGWLRMDRSVVGGLSFMGFNGLMLVRYGGGWVDFHGL